MADTATATATAQATPFETRYGAAIKAYGEAKSQYENGHIEASLNAARRCDESIIKQAMLDKGIPYDSSLTIPEQLVLLSDNGVFNTQMIKRLDRIRDLGNKGSHNKKNETPTKADAEQCLQLLKRVMDDVQKSVNDTASWGYDADASNRPQRKSDYYSKKTRVGYGNWANIYSREELLTDSDCHSLYKKAGEGDPEAMLDLAVGFLSKWDNIWNREDDYYTLVNFPTFTTRDGQQYNEHRCYDFRYYYWVIEAAKQAMQLTRDGKWNEVPRMYLVPALCDVLKFLLYIQFWFYEELYRGRQHQDQNKLVDEMFGHRLLNPRGKPMQGDPFEAGYLLLKLLSDYDDCDRTPFHDDMTPEHIRFMLYGAACLFTPQDQNSTPQTIQSWFALSPDDIGRTPDIQLLALRSNYGSEADRWFYNQILKPLENKANQEREWQQAEQRRREEEQRRREQERLERTADYRMEVAWNGFQNNYVNAAETFSRVLEADDIQDESKWGVRNAAKIMEMICNNPGHAHEILQPARESANSQTSTWLCLILATYAEDPAERTRWARCGAQVGSPRYAAERCHVIIVEEERKEAARQEQERIEREAAERRRQWKIEAEKYKEPLKLWMIRGAFLALAVFVFTLVSGTVAPLKLLRIAAIVLAVFTIYLNSGSAKETERFPILRYHGKTVLIMDAVIFLIDCILMGILT